MEVRSLPKTYLIAVAVVVAGSLVSSCGSALPGSAPVPALRTGGDVELRHAVEQSHREAVRGEQLVAEAKTLLQRAQEAEAGCRAAVRKIPKQRPQPVECSSPTPGVEAQPVGVGSAEHGKHGSAPVSRAVAPQYSPSDAP